MIDQLIHPGNKLEKYTIQVGDIELIPENILDVEISFNSNSPVIIGKLLFHDLIDINTQLVWRDTNITINYTDIFGENYEIEFVILNIKNHYTRKNEKVLELELQDTLSFRLSKSYLSKGYTSDPATALNDYIQELGFDSSVINSKTTIDAYNFVIPNNISNLNWFLYEFKKHGIKFYRDKNGLNIKSLQDLNPSSLEKRGDSFTNQSPNQMYYRTIYDYLLDYNKRKDILPYIKSLGFNIETKSFEIENTNDNSDYYLNSDEFNLQNLYENQGFKNIIQHHLNFNEHTSLLKDSYLKQSEIKIVTSGSLTNDLYQIYELDFKGNVGSAESINEGDAILNGEYISTGISDKILLGSFIQQIHLVRADMEKG